MNTLRLNFAIIAEWFYENYVVIKADKCHFLTVGFNELFHIFLSTILKLKMLPRKRFLGQ